MKVQPEMIENWAKRWQRHDQILGDRDRGLEEYKALVSETVRECWNVALFGSTPESVVDEICSRKKFRAKDGYVETLVNEILRVISKE